MSDSGKYAVAEQTQRGERKLSDAKERNDYAGKNLLEKKTSTLDRTVRISGIVFYVWMAIGLTLMLTVGVPDALGFSNALFLVFYTAYALVLLRLAMESSAAAAEPRRPQRPLLSLTLGAAGIWLGGMGIEWSGVHTGWPFGGYHYSWILGPHLFGVPVTLGLAWIAVIGSSALIAGPGTPTLPGRLWKAVQIGTWTVWIDFVLDPAAASRGFWNWSGEGGFYGIPWSNFAAWFVVGTILSLLLPQRVPSRRTLTLGLRLYQFILLMFGLIALQDGLYGPVWIAVAGIVLSEVRVRYDIRRASSGVSRAV
ncbi:carotenoid biosynthesis protein [Saccharibacillus sacchari]|uniref:Carotenoid biosynthesis protein n=1 Tax=Saccharibacillus sacchari TaxID=456493 RepID=A0ACC6PEX8_9BACL